MITRALSLRKLMVRKIQIYTIWYEAGLMEVLEAKYLDAKNNWTVKIIFITDAEDPVYHTALSNGILTLAQCNAKI